MAVIHLNEEGFNRLLASGQPAIVDFWAGWCTPCKMLAPTIDALAEEFDGRAVVAKADIDENPMLADRLKVLSIPTVVFFKDGKEQDRKVGMMPAALYREALEELLDGVKVSGS